MSTFKALHLLSPKPFATVSAKTFVDPIPQIGKKVPPKLTFKTQENR